MQFNVEPRTLSDDLRIYERFFAGDTASINPDASGEGAAIMRYGGLGRDHFRAALAADDPIKAIQDASTQVQSGRVRCALSVRMCRQAKRRAGKMSAGF